MKKVSEETLSGIALFRELPRNTLKKISTLAELAEFQDGQRIFSEGSPGDSFYVLLKGEVQIVKTLSGKLPANGIGGMEKQEKIVSTLAPGDYFGEMALLDEVPRSASARAKGEVSVVRIGREAFWQFAKAAGNSKDAVQTILRLARTMSDRLRQTTLELAACYELGKIFSLGLSVKDLSAQILDQLKLLFPEGSFCALALWNEFNDDYEWVKVVNPSEFPSVLRRSFSRTEAVPMLLESKRDLIFSPNWNEELRFTEIEKKIYGSMDGTMLYVPLFKTAENKLLPSGHWISTCPLLGFFLCCHPHLSNAFDRQMVHLTTTIANLSATALENAKTREEEEARKNYALRRQFVS